MQNICTKIFLRYQPHSIWVQTDILETCFMLIVHPDGDTSDLQNIIFLNPTFVRVSVMDSNTYLCISVVLVIKSG